MTSELRPSFTERMSQLIIRPSTWAASSSLNESLLHSQQGFCLRIDDSLFDYVRVQINFHRKGQSAKEFDLLIVALEETVGQLPRLGRAL